MRSRVEDVMTRQVLAVTPDTPFKELVSLLTAYRISALPVVNAERRVLGVVSEADLLAPQLKRDPTTAGTRQPLLPHGRHDADQVKAAGQVAADFMHCPAVTVAATASLSQAARLLQSRNLKRLVVVGAAGELAGIVTRSDLLKVFLRADDEIRREINQEVIVNTLFLDPGRFTVEVCDGVVTLTGTIEHRGLAGLLVRLVAAVDGVVEVNERLHCGPLGDDPLRGDWLGDAAEDDNPPRPRPPRGHARAQAPPP